MKQTKVRVTFRSAKRDHIPGVRTFYLSSLSGDDVEYVLKVIRTPRRRMMTCTCPDAVHRRFPTARHCKHLRALRRFIQKMHGVTRIAAGVEVEIRVDSDNT